MRIEDIKIFATDIDGTLTDGGMYISSSGETFKRFFVRDGLAVKLLETIGVEVAFISSDDSPVITERAARLKIKHSFIGVSNKVEVLESLCVNANLVLENVAFLGDDLQDFDLMERVGFAAAVGDAHPLIKQRAHYVCHCVGGRGAFREVAEYLIEGQGYSVKEVWQGSQKMEKGAG